MTTFDDKEKAAENKYAHDKELEFKIHARAHKLLGLWAAGKMGLSGALAEEYATSIVTAGFAGAAPHTLFEQVKTDLWAKDIHLTDNDIKAEMHRLEHIAREQLVGE
jgi:hypothetical protein